MELNFKARSFILDAIAYRISWYEEQLRRDDIDEDERSDLTNDMLYMQSLATAFKTSDRDLKSV
jgi:hypothetical protein